MTRCFDPSELRTLKLQAPNRDGNRLFFEHLQACIRCKELYESLGENDTITTESLPVTTATHCVEPEQLIDSAPNLRAKQHLPRIDGYVIHGKLGQGGMGVVYRALQVKLNRIVALKVLPAIVADEVSITRFRREALAAARLHHTNIVPIYDFGESHDSHYYAMELIEGRPLNECINTFAAENVSSASPPQLAASIQQAGEARLTPHKSPSDSSTGGISSSSAGRGKVYFRQVAQWMADAAEALHYAHGQGIMHRDIKPGNMILSNDGRLMITDFGLAKTAEDTSISVVGALIGAIRYVSPEQAMAGRMRVDHRTDIWSLGTTLYELLTFVPAFPGTDQNQILSAIVTKEPTAPRKLNPPIPEDLETICLKALEKDPDHRYATARAMAEDFHRWLDGFSINAKRAGPIRRAQKFARRHRAVTTAAVSALLIFGILWGGMVLRRGWVAADRVGKGKLAEKDNDWSLASEHYRAASEWRPDNADILFNLSRALQEQCDRRFDKAMAADALRYCERAQQLNPNLNNIGNTYGVLLSMNERPDEANKVFTVGMLEGRPAAHINANVAAVHYLAGDDRKTLFALEEAVRDPVRPPTESEREKGERDRVPYFHGYHELATFQLLQRDPHALATVERGIDLKPESDSHFGYHLVQARILLTLPEVRDDVQGLAAVEIADGLFREKYPDPLIKRYLALGRLRAGQIERAQLAIKREREAQDEPVFIQLLTALAEAKAGNVDLAQAALEEVSRSWPNELVEPGSTKRSRHLGMIWFESADELMALRQEVQLALDSRDRS